MSWITAKLLGIHHTAAGGDFLPDRPTINFVSGAVVVDNPAKNRTDITLNTSAIDDATPAPTPDTLVLRDSNASASFGATCHFVRIDASDDVAGLSLSAGSNGLFVDGPSEFDGAVVATQGATIWGNVSLGASAPVTGGERVVFIANATTIPLFKPSGGGILYVQGGALLYRGSNGTFTLLASA